jgi:hypothetical protein
MGTQRRRPHRAVMQALDNSPTQGLAASYYGTPTDERSETWASDARLGPH